MKTKPLGNRVVIQPQEAATESSGGIIIPTNVAEKPSEGTVLAVGPGLRTRDGNIVAMTVTVGDHVLYGKDAGTVIKLDGAQVTVVAEDEIFAIIEEK